MIHYLISGKPQCLGLAKLTPTTVITGKIIDEFLTRVN